MWKHYHDEARAKRRDDQGAVESSDLLQNGLNKQRYFIQKGWKYFKMLSITHAVLLPLLVLALFFQILFAYALPKLGGETLRGDRIGIAVEATINIFLSLSLGIFFVTVNASLSRHHYKIYPQTHPESLMIQIQSRQASEAADKYFAIYSLIDFMGGEQMKDYSTTRLDIIYRLLVDDLILYTQSLDFLLFTPARMGNHAPTWVIDWRSARATWFQARFYLRYTNARRWAFWERIVWQGKVTILRYPGATPDSPVRWDIRFGRQLKVQGRIVSRISWSSGAFEEIGDSPTDELLLRSIQLFLDAATGYSLVEAILQPYEMSTSQQSFRIGLHWCWLVGQGTGRGLAWVVQELRKQSRNRLLSKLGIGGKSPLDLHLLLTNYLAREKIALVHCSSDILSDVGCAPNTVVEGDLVALISGVSFPMVLREKQGEYEVVGPAFFHSVMFGTLWDQLDTDNLDEMVLV
ncbi:hypothetical protein K449DRAFT_391379 [Hypoxylon sp. EC38]|nr:hypothetical protein K449DRAFT_391379 [Hypoxylon sp. EC38]